MQYIFNIFLKYAQYSGTVIVYRAMPSHSGAIFTNVYYICSSRSTLLCRFTRVTWPKEWSLHYTVLVVRFLLYSYRSYCILCIVLKATYITVSSCLYSWVKRDFCWYVCVCVCLALVNYR